MPKKLYVLRAGRLDSQASPRVNEGLDRVSPFQGRVLEIKHIASAGIHTH